MIRKRTVNIDSKELEFDALGRALSASGKRGSKLSEALSGGIVGVPDAKRLEKLPVDRVVVEKQIRVSMDEESLRELADSMEKEGLVQPIVVAEREEGDYLLVAGHRRFYAAKDILGWKTIDAVVLPPLPASKVKLLQFYENFKREELTFGELALFVGDLLYEKAGKRSGLDRDGFARVLRKALYLKSDRADEVLLNAARGVMELLGISKRTLSACLYFWCLPEGVRGRYVACREISAAHCMVLVDHGVNPEEAERWLERAKSGLSRRELEGVIRAEKALSRAGGAVSTGRTKFLQRVYSFGNRLKKSRQLRQDEELRKAVVEYLRGVLRELERGE